MDDLKLVALIASPALAAIAAGASWASVAQSGRLARQAIEPDLSIQLIADPETSTLEAIVHNGGGGPARGTSYILSGDKRRTLGHVGHGVLGPGETFAIATEIPETEYVKGLLVGRDRRGRIHIWTNDEDHDVIRPRRFGRSPYRDIRERFRDAYPDRPSDGLELVRSEATRH